MLLSRSQVVVQVVGLTLILATLAGLVVRRRYHACYSFVAYLAVIAVTDFVVLLRPERFLRESFYLLRELLVVSLRLAVAFELAYRTLRAFPGARATARMVLLLLLVVVLIAVLMPLHGLLSPPTFKDIVAGVQPRLLTGTIWLLMGIAAVILWYRLPVNPLHKAILLGMVPYLLVFAGALNWLVDRPDLAGYRNAASYVHTGAWLVLMGYWTVVAWKPARQTPTPDGVSAAVGTPQPS